MYHRHEQNLRGTGVNAKIHILLVQKVIAFKGGQDITQNV